MSYVTIVYTEKLKFLMFITRIELFGLNEIVIEEAR